MDKYLEKVGDTFGVEERLREIDDGYRVFYNKLKRRYEIHNMKLQPNTLVLVSPYGELDARIIRHVRQTSVSRANDIYDEIEKHNEKILKKQREEELNKLIHGASRAEIMKNLLGERR